ncbi:hypothetical protein [Veronia pacifica]|uniref:Short-chain dehydrogenase n=1 Tax=Veronia pacifica TaxID=1080227 RepID=A0A1C3EPQ5_9GAMM|nr:hypothetical protein [Veronia pacifica]ODA35172.1 hypothetical protein A8L45_04455 [Veronia pacifica]
MKILIIGASKGLGFYLSHHFQDAEVYTISRIKIDSEGINAYQVDVSPDKNPDYSFLHGVKFDLIVYLASLWGESAQLKTSELVNFLNVGPIGYLNVINELIDMGSVNEKCKIVSIGSTAEISESRQYPAFKISKKLLNEISKNLQSIHKNLNFTHFTMGGIGEGRIENSSVAQIINNIISLDENTVVSHITLKSNDDV